MTPRQEVQRANDDCLMIGVHTFNWRQDKFPTAVQCVTLTTDKHAGARITVVMREGESSQEVRRRVLDAVRTIKLPRGIYTVVSLFCLYQPTDAARAAAADRRQNLRDALWFCAVHDQDPMRRVAALSDLWDLADGRLHLN